MSGELVTTTGERAGRALIVAGALDQEAEQRSLLGRYVAEQMVEGTDFGVIPGTANKTLLKPGAEKLTQLFRCVPRYTVEEKVDDWATGLHAYRFRCEIVTLADGLTVAEGVGSCSTYESRYRYRTLARTCPRCGKPAIIKGKAEYGGGWVCFKKKDGCGAKFADADPSVAGQEVGRVENPDLNDQANTVLKIAKKRALVDAAISLARCSDIFTQDVEDFADPQREGPAREERQQRPEWSADEFAARLDAAHRRGDVDAARDDFNRVAYHLPDDLYKRGCDLLDAAYRRVMKPAAAAQ